MNLRMRIHDEAKPSRYYPRSTDIPNKKSVSAELLRDLGA